MKKRKAMVVANWKMNPESLDEAMDLFDGIKGASSRAQNVKTIICPPSVFLSELRLSYTGKKISFGAQDSFWEDKGSYTGYISPKMLKSVDIEYVILGHSERRALGEDNKMVHKKVVEVLDEKLDIILCVGESVRDSQGEYLSFLREQLRSAFEEVSKELLKNVTIAYEPIWAIGKTAGEAMKPQEVHETVIFIRKTLSELYDVDTAHLVQILYGGSVEPSNTEELFEKGEVDGFLVGHASLVPDDFSEMINIVNKIV